jgi:hypothetical protein
MTMVLNANKNAFLSSYDEILTIPITARIKAITTEKTPWPWS